MKNLSYLSISSVIAYPLALAANWEYDPVDTDANTKEELNLQFANYSIDTTGGVLTVTGNIQSYGNSSRISVTGANNLVVGGTFITQYGTTTFNNANIKAADSIVAQYGQHSQSKAQSMNRANLQAMLTRKTGSCSKARLWLWRKAQS